MTNVLLALQSTFSADQLQQLIQLFNNNVSNNITLPDGKIFVGNASNIATAVAMTGDVTITNTGVTSFRNMSALSVLGNNTNAATIPSDITATLSDQVLRVNNSTTAIAWGAINLASSNAITGVLGYNNGGSNSNVSFTPGSILFVGASSYTEDNVNLFYNDSTDSFTLNGVILKGNNTTRNFQFSTGNLSSLTTAVESTVFGHNSGNSITTGNFNTFYGKTSGASTTTGNANTFIGGYSGQQTTTASSNVGVGYFSLNANVTTSNNVAIGMNSLIVYTGGSSPGNMVAIGFNAGATTVTGDRCVYIGTSAGRRTLGGDNTYIGYLAGSGSTTIGNTINSENTGVGWQAGLSIGTGVQNSFFGKSAMNGNATTGISGNLNSAFGYNSLQAITSASNNSIFGAQSGTAITTGSNHVLIGEAVGQSITTGTQQLLIGYNINTTTATGTGFMSIGNAIYGTTITGTGTTISTGNIGFFVNTPTARVHLPAGSATANTAPLKFTSGTNLTTAETGSLEYNGTNLFFTRVGTTRETIITGNVTVAAATLDTTQYVSTNINGVAVKLAMIV